VQEFKTVAPNAGRIAACSGAIFIFLLIGAPGAASADPAGSGGTSNQGGQNHQPVRGDKPDSGPANGTGAGPQQGGTNKGPHTSVGNGRAGTIGGSSATQPGGRVPPEDVGPADLSGSPDSSNGPADLPNPPHAPPTAQVGNGRSPAYEPATELPPPPQMPAPAEPTMLVTPPPPAAVMTPPARSWVDRTSSVLQQIEAAQPNSLSSPFLGLAGLVLLPAAATALGYRQAKAAQALRTRRLQP
jgi:hypothetical protein